jgi:glycosyltransferase involved in cell wall biosynthesis
MSEFETHPLVALEAAAARRRLLVADRAGLGELVAAGSARGVSLDASAEALAAAIFDELGRPVPEQPPELTSWDECTAALVDLYGSVT